MPLVSIILCVRNGMPHVRNAVESVRSLRYSNYELVVQDGVFDVQGPSSVVPF